MNEEESLKTLLNINYNKLLAYLAGNLVAFFMLFQITTEIENLSVFSVALIVISAFSGIVVLTIASYKNYEEIIDFENRLGLSELMEPSHIFSVWKNDSTKERKVSGFIKFIVVVFIVVSFIMSLSSLNESGVIEWIYGLFVQSKG